MSHGGFGGGGGHSGFGHGGGHSGFAHGGHGVGHGASLGHGVGLGGGQHGTVFGHILHTLGFGQHGHHGVAGAGHHPDQSPTWNQAMQGEKRPGFFLRVDKRPFMVLFFLVFTSFFWLWIVYNVHHSESSHNNSAAGTEPAPAQAAAPAAGYGTEAYAQAQTQAMQNYASQYMSAATANGAAQMYNPTGMAGTGYGGTMAPSAGVSAVTPYGVPAGGYSAYGAAGAPGAYGAPGAFPARQQPGFGYYSYGQMQTGYAPTANGRARLVVAR